MDFSPTYPAVPLYLYHKKDLKDRLEQHIKKLSSQPESIRIDKDDLLLYWSLILATGFSDTTKPPGDTITTARHISYEPSERQDEMPVDISVDLWERRSNPDFQLNPIIRRFMIYNLYSAEHEACLSAFSDFSPGTPGYEALQKAFLGKMKEVAKKYKARYGVYTYITIGPYCSVGYLETSQVLNNFRSTADPVYWIQMKGDYPKFAHILKQKNLVLGTIGYIARRLKEQKFHRLVRYDMKWGEWSINPGIEGFGDKDALKVWKGGRDLNASNRHVKPLDEEFGKRIKMISLEEAAS